MMVDFGFQNFLHHLRVGPVDDKLHALFEKGIGNIFDLSFQRKEPLLTREIR